MSYKVLIHQKNIEISVGTEETVLQAALKTGVEYPFSCQSGKCGACKSRLHEGEIEHLSHFKFTLTEIEKSEGIFLACRAVPKSNLEISWLEESEDVLPVKEFTTKVSKKNKLSESIFGIQLDLPNESNFDFKPGQFALLTFGTCAPRSYSMAVRSQDGKLDFFIKPLEQGCTGSHIISNLRVGDEVKIKGPYDNAYIRKNHTGPIIAAAGGSGLAPIKSIVEEALASKMRQPIYLYFGVRAESELYLTQHFKDMEITFPNFRFIPVCEGLSTLAGVRFGRLSDVIFSDFPEFTDEFTSYLAGPPLMVEHLAREFKQLGMNPAKIYADPFYSNQDLLIVNQ